MVSEQGWSIRGGENAYETEEEKRSALARAKGRATGLLVFAGVVFFLSLNLETQFPWLGYVKAFSEAAMVGALADWFAVVALFRHPLGVPIPHTNIIVKKKVQLAQALGRFVEGNFFTEQALVKYIGEEDLVNRMAESISDPGKADRVGKFVIETIPDVLDLLDNDDVRDFLQRTFREELKTTDISSRVAQLLEILTKDRKHHELLDVFIRRAIVLSKDEKSKEWLKEKIIAWAGELDTDAPDYFDIVFKEAKVGTAMLFGDVLAEKILGFVESTVKKVEESKSHEVRKEFDRKVEEFIFNLRNSREYREAVEDIKDRILESEEVSEYVRNLWDKLKLWVQEDAKTPKSVVRERVSQWMIKWGQRIRTEEKMRVKVNDIIIEIARKIVGNTKDKVSDFIYKNVSEWNPEELVGKIELNIGKDLQMIRINGTLVGGTVGVLLYSIAKFIHVF